MACQRELMTFLLRCVVVLLLVHKNFGIEYGEIRLAGGNSSHEGRIEVYNNGKWGTIRGYGWDSSDAAVACRQLGFSGVVSSFYDAEYFGEGVGKIWWEFVSCIGNEGLLTDCDYNECDGACTNHAWDVGVICSTEVSGDTRNGDVRLVDGANDNEGRVEIFYGDVWGTVCDDSWDPRDSDVICRMLGYDRSGVRPPPDSHGPGNGLIVLDDLNCLGYEESISECPHSQWMRHNCIHNEDVGVSCLYAEEEYNGAVRLVNGSSESEGRVEVYFNGTWGTVCADNWSLNDGAVICRQLGFSGVLEVVTDGSSGESSDDEVGIILDGVFCFGSEGQILECVRFPWYYGNCTTQAEAAVVCDTAPKGTYRTGDVRLLPDTGVIEVHYAGAWGTICPFDWDIDDGDVVCRQLGLSYAWDVSEWRDPTNQTSDVILSDVYCRGYEDNIGDCSKGDWHRTDCPTTSFATVSCLEGETARIRLVDGESEREGRVEVYYAGSWGTVCGNSFELFDAQVICRELGFLRAFAVRLGAYYGEGKGSIFLDGLSCDGTERTIYECGKNDWKDNSCTHSQDVGVVCVPEYEEEATETAVRLKDGQTGDSEGRVEIYHHGAWGTVCDDGWGYNDEKTVCKQLGYRREMQSLLGAYFGKGTGDILLDEVECGFHDTNLYLCQHSGWGVHDCTHDEDISVRCYSADYLDSRLRNGFNPYSGRAEVYEGGTWHKIAFSNFTRNEANVICREQGFRETISVYPENVYQNDIYVPFINGALNCLGSEASFRECEFTPVDVTNISENIEAAVVDCTPPDDGLTGGQIAGIVISSVVAAFLLGLIIFGIYHKYHT